MPYHIPPTTKAVFFDLNGTLLRDKEAHLVAFQMVLQEYGISLSTEELRHKTANRLNQVIWPEIFDSSLDSNDIEALSAVKERTYCQLLPTLATLTPGSKELIIELKHRNIYLGLVTNAPSEPTAFVLHYLRLEGLFDTIVTASDATLGKPSPEAYVLALQRSGARNSQALVFEDSPVGVQAAVAAHLETIGVLPEYSEELLRRNGASAVISDFTEIQF